MQSLITILGGVAEVFHGDVLVIDFDDWNDSDTTQEQRQSMVEDIQLAGYRAIWFGHPDDEDARGIQIFRPDQDYADFITNTIPDNNTFVVYDPKEKQQ